MEKLEIVKQAIILMKIDYDNWNACLEHCPSIRDSRHNLGYYDEEIKREIYKLNKTEATNE